MKKQNKAFSYWLSCCTLILLCSASLQATSKVQTAYCQETLEARLESVNQKLIALIQEACGVGNNIIPQKIALLVTKMVPEMVRRFAVISDKIDDESVLREIARLLLLEKIVPIIYANCVTMERESQLKLDALRTRYQTYTEWVTFNKDWIYRAPIDEQKQILELEQNIHALKRMKWRLFFLHKISQFSDFLSSDKTPRYVAAGSAAALLGAALTYTLLKK